MMEVWAKDAEEFGIPFQTQKGLIFLLAINLRVTVQVEDPLVWIQYTRKLSHTIRKNPPHIPEGAGGNFDDGSISELLAELVYMINPDFSPRELEKHGETFCWWPMPTEHKLPRCLEGGGSLRDWEEVMISLCSQIGEYIDMDLEGAYIAGFQFIDSYVRSDMEGTLEVAHAITTLPPQLLYFRTMLDIDPERLAQFGPISKIMDAFACGDLEQTEKVYLAAYNYLRSMRQATGRNVWEYPIEVVADVAIRLKPFGDVDISRESWYANTLENFRSNGWATPAVCTTKEEVLGTVYAAIQGTWGFDCLNEDLDTMLPCSNILRKCAFVYSCAVLTVLNPIWNPLATSTVEKSANELEADESPENDEPGFIEICKSAEKGDAEAQYKLGYYYYNGEGIAKNDEQAAKWWRKAAEQEHLAAQSALRICYSNGIGVVKDDSEVMKWSRKTAEKGDPQGQYILGNCYIDGIGTEKNEAEAVKWYHKAAEQGHAEAQHNLGFYYAIGTGVAKDEVKAVKWLRKAAEQGLAQAQQSLGICYYNGSDLVKNKIEAYKWFLLAVSHGNESAKENIDAIISLLHPEERAEGQRLAQEWRAAHI
jgi:TPR repeat protein